MFHSVSPLPHDKTKEVNKMRRLVKLHLLLAVLCVACLSSVLTSCVNIGEMYSYGEWDLIEYGGDSDILLNLGELDLDDMDR